MSLLQVVSTASPYMPLSLEYLVVGGGGGVVIIRYTAVFPQSIATGGVTYTSSGGYRIYKFTSDGTLLFT